VTDMNTPIRELAESQQRRQSIRSRSARATQLRGGVVGVHASFEEDPT
jgi:hypothetical protein